MVTTPEENKAIVRRAYEEGMNKRDLGVIDEVFAPGYTQYFPSAPPARGLAAFKEFIVAFLAAFPDIQFVVEDALAEGDRVALRWTGRGTNTGEFRGLPSPTKSFPPSGRPVFFTANDIYRIEDGKIAEEWNTLEQIEVMRQIGALEVPE